MAYIRVFWSGGKQVYSIIRMGAQCLSSSSRLYLPYPEAPMMSSSALLPCAFQLPGPCAFRLLGPCAFQPPGLCALSSTINCIIVDSSNCLHSIEVFKLVNSPENTYFAACAQNFENCVWQSALFAVPESTRDRPQCYRVLRCWTDVLQL